jgi:hypothetical protein
VAKNRDRLTAAQLDATRLADRIAALPGGGRTSDDGTA